MSDNDAARGRPQQNIRVRNLASGFAAVQQGLHTRAEIADATNVSELTDGAAGRRSALIGVSPEGDAYLGLEVRGDALSAYLADAAGRPRFRATVDGVVWIRRPERVIDELVVLARDALEESARQRLSPAGVTIAIPGDVDADAGTVRSASELQWSELPLRAIFRERLSRPDLPVELESARTLAALAELERPTGPPLESYLYVTADGGVAARVIVNRRLLPTARPTADDGFAHITVDVNGSRCRCGRRGCLATRTSRTAVLEAAGLGDGSPADLLEHARTGNGRVLAALADCGRWLGVALATVLNLIPVPMVVLAGDFAALAPWMVPAVESEVHRRVPGASSDWPAIVSSQFGPEAAARGAAMQARGELRC